MGLVLCLLKKIVSLPFSGVGPGALGWGGKAFNVVCLPLSGSGLGLGRGAGARGIRRLRCRWAWGSGLALRCTGRRLIPPSLKKVVCCRPLGLDGLGLADCVAPESSLFVSAVYGFTGPLSQPCATTLCGYIAGYLNLPLPVMSMHTLSVAVTDAFVTLLTCTLAQ